AAIVLAWRVRYQFVVRHVAGSLRAALAIFVIGAAAVLAVGALLVRRFGHSGSADETQQYVLRQMLSEIGRHGSEGTAVSAPLWVHGCLGVLGAFFALLSAVVLFRPTPAPRTLSADDEARVRTLLRDFGDLDSLGYFATPPHKAGGLGPP